MSNVKVAPGLDEYGIGRLMQVRAKQASDCHRSRLVIQSCHSKATLYYLRSPASGRCSGDSRSQLTGLMRPPLPSMGVSTGVGSHAAPCSPPSLERCARDSRSPFRCTPSTFTGPSPARLRRQAAPKMAAPSNIQKESARVSIWMERERAK